MYVINVFIVDYQLKVEWITWLLMTQTLWIHVKGVTGIDWRDTSQKPANVLSLSTEKMYSLAVSPQQSGQPGVISNQ